jgi:cytochrome c-type biogenesis protein CcmF
MAFEPRKAVAAGGIAIGAWLILGALAEVAERLRLFRVPLAEVGRRTRALPLGAWGMTLAHAGLGLFVLGAVVETGFKVEAAAPLGLDGTVTAGRYSVRLDDVRIVEGPNYLAEQGHLTVTPTDGGPERTVIAERRFFPAGGQTTTEVGLDFRGLDDVYVVLGERRSTPEADRAWTVRVYWNPWARLIFLGPLVMAIGGVLSLLDRRLRTGVAGRKTAVESAA